MKKQMTVRISIALLLAMLCTQLSAFAAEPDNNESSPWYIGMSSVAVNVDVTSYGRADCFGEAELRDGYKCDITLQLWQSSDQSDWDNIKTWTGSGTGTVNLDKMWYVDSGYYYQTSVYVAVYTTSGTFVEGKTLYSGIDYY